MERSPDILEDGPKKIAAGHAGGEKAIEQEYKRWRDIWSAGQGVAQIHEVKPAGEIVKEIASEYLATVNNLPR